MTMEEHLPSDASRAAAAVDPQALVALVQAAVQIPSITPDESAIAAWALDQLQGGPWGTAGLIPVEGDRSNVYATASGTRDDRGRALLLAGHLDTVHADGWAEQWAGTERESPFAAAIVDGEIWGRGVADQKAGICMIIEALRAIDRCGFRPSGVVTALLVADEESGQTGSGVSAGMRSAVQAFRSGALPQPDFAIYTEPTTSAIYPAQMGFLIAEIAVTGRSAYFGRPELGADALKAGHELLSRLWRHSDDIAQQASHPLVGRAFLVVTEVRSGGNVAVPGDFAASLIRKILPGETVDDAAAGLRAVVASIESDDISTTITFTAPRDHALGGTPNEVDIHHAGVEALGTSIATVTGTAARLEGAPYWSEGPFLRDLGIPSVYFAAGDIADCHTSFERLDINELVAATRTLAHFVASWCGLEPLEWVSPASRAAANPSRTQGEVP